MIAIPSCSTDTTLDAFKMGVLTSPDLYNDLVKFPCVTLADVQAKALAHIRLEEDVVFHNKMILATAPKGDGSSGSKWNKDKGKGNYNRPSP